MFIPLNSVIENDWPNVLVVGDTASAFYLLGLLSPLKLNVYVADTGVSGNSPLRFRNGPGRTGPDTAGAYYDFFESPERIGAGTIRRTDMVIHSGTDSVSEWTRSLRIPLMSIKFLPVLTQVEIEGVTPDMEGLSRNLTAESTLTALITGFINASATGRYRAVATTLSLDSSGGARIEPPRTVKLPMMIVPEETRHSAWDYVNDVLEPGESVVSDTGDVPLAVTAGHGNPRLIELGIPELHIIKVRNGKDRFVELTGDLGRVFDGQL